MSSSLLTETRKREGDSTPPFGLMFDLCDSQPHPTVTSAEVILQVLNVKP